MESILVTPKNTKELELITELLVKMKIRSKRLSLEEMEDLYLAEMMESVDKGKKVSRESIMKKLG